MRYHDIISPISEAPLASYDTHGDFDQPGSLGAKDRKLLSSPSQPERLGRLLKAGNVDIAVHAVNVSPENLHRIGVNGPEEERSAEYRGFINLSGQDSGPSGETSPSELQKLFGVTISVNPSAINVVVLGNSDGSQPLTPWMLIHRLTHMVEDAAARKNGRIDPDLAQAWGNLVGYVQQGAKIGNQPLALDTLRSMATMKSASMAKGGELANEFLTQYFSQGRTPLKPVQGVPEAVCAQLQSQIEQRCAAVEKLMVGRIFMSF